MKAFVVDGHDNGIYFFRGRTDVQRCPTCGALTRKWEETLSSDAVSSTAADVSSSYDGVVVVSDRFRAVYHGRGWTGLHFTRVGVSHWAVAAGARVRFDSARRKTRFEAQCASCGRFGAVVGATPAFLFNGERIGEGEFVWTDIEFGSGDEQQPLLLCGSEVAGVLRHEGLVGLELQEVRSA